MSRRFPLILVCGNFDFVRLPFLYHTRTIVGHQDRKQASTSRRRHRGSGRFWAKAGEIENTTKPGAKIVLAQSNADESQSTDRDGRLDGQRSYLQERAERDAPAAPSEQGILGSGLQSSSTMTKSEREAFTKLLESLTQKVPGESLAELTKLAEKDKSKRRRAAARESRDAMAVSEKIIPIARSVLEGYRDKNRSATELKSLSKLQEALKGPAKRAEEFFQENHDKSIQQLKLASAGIPATLEDMVHEIGFKELEKTAKLVDMATEKTLGDYEIWKIFEERIFSLMRFLELEDDTLEIGTLSRTQTKKKARKKKAKSTNEEPPVKEESTETGPVVDGKTSSKDESTARDPTPPTGASEPNFSPSDTPFNLPSYIPRLTLISRLYPASINFALSTLIQRFPTSPISNAILPRLKALGRTSYVLGANTAFYNTLIQLRWRIYSDLRGIDRLLAEMRNGGVDHDADTLQIIQSIGIEAYNERRQPGAKSRRVSRRVTREKGLAADRRPYHERARSESWWSMAEQRHFLDRVVYQWANDVREELQERNREMYRRRFELKREQKAKREGEAENSGAKGKSMGKGDRELESAAVEESVRQRRSRLDVSLLRGQRQRRSRIIPVKGDSNGQEERQAAVG